MKNEKNKYVKSALNYTGGKYNLLKQIIPLFPKEFNNFIDLFCGGGVVTVNIIRLIDEEYFSCNNEIIVNDINEKVIKLLKDISKVNIDTFISKIDKYIEKYNLSDTKKYGYEYYATSSRSGLGKYNKESYAKLRKDYNNKVFGKDDSIIFYLLIVYGFNNQIRFNSKGEFNLPVGKRDFNVKMIEKLRVFNNILMNRKIKYLSNDFRNMIKLNKGDFLYVDPPYSISIASYSENNGWTKEDDLDLFKYLDNAHKKGVKFAFSNVVVHKGKINNELLEWAKKYKIIYLDYDYNNSNYQSKAKYNKTVEVLIVNY